MKDQKEELRKQSQLPLHQKEYNYPRINLPKEAKDLYSENYNKTLMKEIKDETDGKIYHVLGLEESILSK